MEFQRCFKTLIKKSDNTYVEFDLNNGVIVKFLNKNYEIKSEKRIFTGSYNFLDTYYDIDNNDRIYGLICDYEKLIYINLNEKVLIKKIVLKVDSNKFFIQCPYIIKSMNKEHIILLKINKSNYDKKAQLLHYYYSNNKWTKSVVDNIYYSILTNYLVHINDENIYIFYLNKINTYEEIFLACFDFKLKKWLKPVQLTNSNKQKVYLSMTRSLNDTFNIIYSEKNDNKYYCMNLNVEIKGDKTSVISNKIISKTLTCNLPNIIYYNSNLYAQWVEYNKVYTSTSLDYGDTWSKPVLDYIKDSECSIHYDYRSNNDDEKNIKAFFYPSKYIDIV